MAPPDFSERTRNLLAFRAGLICSNPNCGALTAGPVGSDPELALKIGEAAHIAAARRGEARWDRNMNDRQRAHPSNGIWLCPSCHKKIDKQRGKDYPTPLVLQWKTDHEAMIKQLMLDHVKPLPRLRVLTKEGNIAQKTVDLMEAHGALFVDQNTEYPPHVLKSVERLRKNLEQIFLTMTWESKLKKLIKDLAGDCREFMNQTSNISGNNWHELQALRTRIGKHLSTLKSDYECDIRGRLQQLIPSYRSSRA